jgi:carboxypeptidase A2
MKMLWGLVFLAGYCLAQEMRYDGYHQVLLHTDHEWQFDILRHLQANGKAVLWEDYRPANGEFDILLAPEGVQSTLNVLAASGMQPKVLEVDFQKTVEAELAKAKDHRAYDPNNFNTLEDIYSEISRLANSECPSGFTCSVRSIGTTYGGNDIRIISVTQGSGRRAIWYDSLIHAREWLAGSTGMRILAQLMTGYGSDSDATNILNNYDFHYVPVLNPDGYAYTWESSSTRFWRKNRSPNSGSSCLGTDLNRNADGPWNAGGSSSNPCSDTYHGSSANSELETQAYQAEITRLGNVDLAISIHSYARMYLVPYGTNQIYPNCNQYPDYADLNGNAAAAVAAIHQVSPGTGWVHGDVCSTIYIASGSSMDWAKLRGGVKYVSTPELRGTSFAPPVSEITPSFNENYAALAAMVNYISRH